MNNKQWVDLFPLPLNMTSALAFVTDSHAGGIDIFLGTTRAQTNTQGCQLIALDYEAFESMAKKQLDAIASNAFERWPVARLVIHHRTGRVAVGEPSVLIAVSTPHRREAFDACRWVIDELKKEVTIWKKEIWNGAAESWVHPDH